MEEKVTKWFVVFAVVLVAFVSVGVLLSGEPASLAGMQGITERASVQVPSPAFCAGVCKTKCPTDSNTFLLHQNGVAAPRCRDLTTAARQRIANCVTLRGKQCPPGI